jgi:hypothetical protein
MIPLPAVVDEIRGRWIEADESRYADLVEAVRWRAG